MKRLTDSQLSEAEGRAKLSGIPLSTCPTCYSRPDENGEIVNGTYKNNGKEYQCDCNQQKRLRLQYLYANIPSAYYPLDWSRDFVGPEHIKLDVQSYLDNWKGFRHLGIGLELAGGGLGTGKTMAASHIARYLIRGCEEEVYFCEFSDLLGNEFIISPRILESHILILDEVKKPYSDKQRDYFGSVFEDLIRTRTNWLGVTILTTNLSEDEINYYYPRAFSLLRAKEVRIDFTGYDFRLSKHEKRLIKNALDVDVYPIV